MKTKRARGVRSALASALFLGLVPIFGKQAILLGFAPLAVVAIRTTLAAAVLLIIMLIFRRGFLYIYPVGLLGCVLAGLVNGLGSILYYTALSRLQASIGQLIYSFYPLFMAFWLLLDRQPINRLTFFRLVLALPGVVLLISTGTKQVDMIGAGLMLGSAVLYALHLLINQRVLYEVPAPTVTLYTLLSMSATVLIAYFAFDRRLPPPQASWLPVLAMAAITFFSRITLFMGVKNLGSLQTALLGLGELLVTVVLAQLMLGERLTTLQWVGAGCLAVSLFLVGFDKITPEKRHNAGMLSWLNPPQIPAHDLPMQSP